MVDKFYYEPHLKLDYWYNNFFYKYKVINSYTYVKDGVKGNLYTFIRVHQLQITKESMEEEVGVKWYKDANDFFKSNNIRLDFKCKYDTLIKPNSTLFDIDINWILSAYHIDNLFYITYRKDICLCKEITNCECEITFYKIINLNNHKDVFVFNEIDLRNKGLNWRIKEALWKEDPDGDE